jgi:protein ImuA
MFRPPSAANESSPAALRLKLETAAGGIAVRILKRRGAVLSKPVQVKLAPVVPLPRPAQNRIAAAHVVACPLPA